MKPDSLSDIDLKFLVNGKTFSKSPIAWEDEVFYFLLVDRFSDGNENGFKDNDGNIVAEGTTSLFQNTDNQNAISNEENASKWRDAGGRYVGGNLKGLTSKIGYLKRLGISTIWVSPVLKQVNFQDTYHGYGIQDFLQVNPKFGTLEDLRHLVTVAHEHGMYVILDIILNHVGNIFSYDSNRQPKYIDQNGNFDPKWDGNTYPVIGFNDKDGTPSIPFQKTDVNNDGEIDADSAIWPVEFQDPAYYTCKGHISNFDYDPEFREGDFFDLKDVHHGQGNVDDYDASPALLDLCKAYKYWIAITDIDGYRIDTIKHMDTGATRLFGSEMHEFAQSIGKNNFILVGEIAGGREFAFTTLQLTGLDAALGIDEIPDKMEFLVKGLQNPNDYFSLFRNSELVGKESHTWFRNKVLTFFNDHDQVNRGEHKARFCSNASTAGLVLNALALNVTTLGIPCIYYGTEQSFNGHGDGGGADKYIREAMFGGAFGSFESKGVHFFNEESLVYKEFAKIISIRRSKITLRRGRQFLRDISGDGIHFGLPQMVNGPIQSVIAWSRILDDEELLLAVNTDPLNAQTAWVTIDATLHKPNEQLTCIYSSKPDDLQESSILKTENKNGVSVLVSIPAGGFAIFK